MPVLNVREIEKKDVDLIVNYWVNSTSEQLVGMGVDLDKFPDGVHLKDMLNAQLFLPLEEKKAYALIWEIDGRPVGHSNVNQIIYREKATMHLHLWTPIERKKGYGTQLVKMSLPFYFNKLKIKTLLCEPYALNPAPNKTLDKVGFEFDKKYRTIPGSINFEQEVNRWIMTKEKFDLL